MIEWEGVRGGMSNGRDDVGNFTVVGNEMTAMILTSTLLLNKKLATRTRGTTLAAYSRDTTATVPRGPG